MTQPESTRTSPYSVMSAVSPAPLREFLVGVAVSVGRDYRATSTRTWCQTEMLEFQHLDHKVDAPAERVTDFDLSAIQVCIQPFKASLEIEGVIQDLPFSRTQPSDRQRE